MVDGNIGLHHRPGLPVNSCPDATLINQSDTVALVRFDMSFLADQTALALHPTAGISIHPALSKRVGVASSSNQSVLEVNSMIATDGESGVDFDQPLTWTFYVKP
ncbi:MAG: hypothetical protein RH949_24835 [Coleofasciculus sp. A1-SPW-01]|uniref:hypothetical protein n=1 Tax=Coleofasciculus sp. A1-SPW-01 TaxID=3070819 RepID=UPI0032F1A19C